MALSNLITYETKREANKARNAGETVIRVDGGFAVVSNEFYRIWKKASKAA